MSRVKLLKMELWDDDIPSLCMVCGKNPAQTRHPTTLRHAFFPLNLFGALGTFATPKKMPMNIVCCNDCKTGYLNEVNMSMVWDVARALIPFAFLYAATSLYADKGLKAFLVPVIFAFIVYALQALYFWTIGKKSAIRCVKMDEGTVSLELPNGHWGVAYTKYKQDKNQRRKASQAPLEGDTPPASDGPPPPGAPAIGQDAPAAGPVSEPTSGGGGIDLEGAEFAKIPPNLPEFLDAVKQGDIDRMESTLKDGGDFKEALGNGMNGLHIASIAGLMQIADMLIRRGIPVDSEMGNGLTPMHLAVQSNNQSMVGLLLAKKGNPNHGNKDGRTPLHWCAAVKDSRLDPNNRYKMANVLVRGGGDINAKDKDGKTPADLANQGGEGKVAEAFS